VRGAGVSLNCSIFYYLTMTILLIGGGAKGGELRRIPKRRSSQNMLKVKFGPAPIVLA
jgi:hypothetical protein